MYCRKMQYFPRPHMSIVFACVTCSWNTHRPVIWHTGLTVRSISWYQSTSIRTDACLIVFVHSRDMEGTVWWARVGWCVGNTLVSSLDGVMSVCWFSKGISYKAQSNSRLRTYMYRDRNCYDVDALPKTAWWSTSCKAVHGSRSVTRICAGHVV